MSFPVLRPVQGAAGRLPRSQVGRRAITASVVLLALAGCATPPAPNNDSPQESQLKLLAVLDRTEDQIGGTWDNADSPSPTTCVLPGSSDKGVTFTGARTYTGSPLDDAGVNNLITFLKAEGFEAGQAPLGRFTNVMAVNPDNKALYVRVSIGSRVTTLSGQAACVPGDAWEELQRVKKEVGSAG